MNKEIRHKIFNLNEGLARIDSSLDNFWKSMLSASVNLDMSIGISLVFPNANEDLPVNDISVTVEGVDMPIVYSFWSDSTLMVIVEQSIQPIDIVTITFQNKIANNKVVTNNLPFYGTIYIAGNVARFPTLDPYNVDHWNELFNLPTNGGEFTHVRIRSEDNLGKAYLFGGYNITLSNFLPDNYIGPNVDFVKREYFRGLYDNYSIKTVNTLGFSSFQYDLRWVDLLAVTTIEGNAFHGLGTERISIPLVTHISPYAFQISSGEIDISGAIIIDEYAFASSSIDEINIPTGVTSIKDRAFSVCNSLNVINCYPMVAPEIVGTPFDDNGAILHIKAGATGYNVAPWTDTAKFVSIIQDL